MRNASNQDASTASPKVPDRAIGTVMKGGLSILLTTVIFIVLVVGGAYLIIEKDAIIEGYSGYIGAPLLALAFVLPPIMHRYTFKFEPARVRDVFFSQLAFLITVSAAIGLGYFPEVSRLLAFQPWFSATVTGVGTAMYVVAWLLRKRPKYIIGGFLIAVASVLVFYGGLGLLAGKYVI
jgi:hypothetical protein